VLPRISNPDAESSASGAAGADAARRNEARKGNEAETRDRAAKFRAALGKQQAEDLSEGRAQAAAERAKQDGAQGRADERGRDRAAAADVLGRLGLADGPEAETHAHVHDRPAAGTAGDRSGQAAGAKPVAGTPGEATATQAGGADAAKLQGNQRPEDSSARDATSTELGPEMKAIEDAIQKVMDQSEGGGEVATPPADAFAIPGATPWARPEGPARPEAPRQLPSPAPGQEVYHKLLLGQGPGGPEARLSITQGPLAGLQIQLTHGPAGVQAAVLTQGASSRQTLVSAMDQIAQRLRQKGHNLDVRFGSSGGQGAGQAPRRG
jgi:hypothetical protein